MNETTYNHKQTKRFALIGFLGGLICSVADYFLEYMGRESTTMGFMGTVKSAWADVSAWRFPASIWIVSLAVPMYVVGMIAVIRQMRATHKKLGAAFGGSFLLGSLGGLFIHISMCLMPVVYQYLIANTTQEMAVGAVDAMTASFIGPFFLYYSFLILVPLVLWCAYCFQKGGAYKPLTAVVIVGFTLLCIALSKIPALNWLGVGAVSRMIALWCWTVYRTEQRAENGRAGKIRPYEQERANDIHRADIALLPRVTELAALLWPEHPLQELTDEFSQILNREDAAIFLAYADGAPIGFAQCQLRHDYVEGTQTSPVGYLEGVFVREAHRHNGYASALVLACEEWAKAQGCREFASDCELYHDVSRRFHKALGFSEANRIICFTKRLGS